MDSQIKTSPDIPEAPVDDDAEDVIWGAVNIGKAIKCNRRRTYYLLESGALSGAAAKTGGIWCGSKKRLQRLVTTGEVE